MPNLGVTVTQRSTPPSRGTFSQTGTAFIAGKADLGSITVAKRLLSIGDFILNYGARVTANAVFYDSVDTAFQEGCSVVWAAREVGPSKAFDAINIPGTSGTGLVWTATDPGVSGVKLQVTNGDSGSNRILKVVDAVTGALIAATAQYTANSAAVGTLGPGVVTIGGGTGLTPVMAATAPTGGTSDAAAVTSTQVQAATDLFLKAYGPGQILAPGQGTISGVNDVLDAHAKANNRFALWDNTDTATTATLTTTDLATVTATDKTYGAFCGTWVQVQGVNNSPVTRNVPASAVYAGLCARVDAAGNPNRAVIGFDFAPSSFVVSLNNEFSDATVQTLYDAGVNTLQTYYGVRVSRGFRTPASASTEPINNQANCARLRMALIALAGPIGATYYGKPIDGRGLLESAYASDLEAMLQGLWQANALFGEDGNGDAYVVDASATVNTTTTIAQGQLIAVITYTPTTAAISVQIQLAAIPVSA